MLRRKGARREEFEVGELVQWSWGKKGDYYGLVIDKRDHMGIWVYTVMFENKTVSGFNPEELKRLRIV